MDGTTGRRDCKTLVPSEHCSRDFCRIDLVTITNVCVWLKCHRVKTRLHGSGALVLCPMAANIEQVLQALKKITKILRLMAVNHEAQAQQAQYDVAEVGLDERYFRSVEKLESHNNWKDFSFQFGTAVGAVDPQVKKMLQKHRLGRHLRVVLRRGDLDGLESDLRGAIPFV